MPYELRVYNPSNYSRNGHIAIPWQPIVKATGYSPDGLKLYQDSGTPLYYQVDRIDPHNPSHDTLSFFLSKPVEPGPEDYSKPGSAIIIEGVKAKEKRQTDAPEQKSNLELSNNQMDLRLNLTPESEDGEGFWYSGSARSIRLEKLRLFGSRMEYLDTFSQFISGHDPEKRGLQLEDIQLSYTNSKSGLCQQIYLYNQPYRLVSECKGPVRHCVTLASRPFYHSTQTDGPPIKCELYRVFSLYEDRDYLLEELFIDIKSDKNSSEKKDSDLYFVARYFTYMRMGLAQVSRYDYVPDWFSITDLTSLLGYGFATDVHVDYVTCPHPAFPDEQLKGNTFSWQLQPCKAAVCLHLFSRFPQDCSDENQGPDESFRNFPNLAVRCFESRAGKAWYELIYKPLRAQMAGQGAAYVF